MKQVKRGFYAAILTCGMLLLTSCKHDTDYLKPYLVTDEERVAYAEKVLGVTIDLQQDWVLTSEHSVTITANANLSGISQVAVLDGNPYAGSAVILATAPVTNGAKAVLSFRAPSASEVLYAACMTNDGKCIARPFLPGEDTSVSFIEKPEPLEVSATAQRRASENAIPPVVVNPPTYKNFRIKDFFNFRNALYDVLPEGQNNSAKLDNAYDQRVQIRENDFNFYEVPLVFIGGIGKGSTDSDIDNLGHMWVHYDQGQVVQMEKFIMKDHFKNVFQPKYDNDTKSYILEGMYLVCKDADGNTSTQFQAGDLMIFELFIGEEQVSDYDDQRARVFSMNGEVFVACEDGDDYDYNDRLFWFPYGTANIQVYDDHFKPKPYQPQTWTYAWEDRDFGDYDMNDCVIEVQENADDKSKLDITLVALGGSRRLWLGFDNKNAKDYTDYIPVFDKELHEVLGVPAGTLVNTGRATAEPVTVTLSKPDYFDFQKCSFILGCMFEDDQKGVYESDYYAVRIAREGQDPHSIVIPGKWQWPTETTSIVSAYPKFADWAHDVKDPTSKNWYMFPVDGKVIKR